MIFLDEPTTGLDPRSRRTMWEVIRLLAASGVTIFLTTQYLDEADELATTVAVLDHGTIVASGTPEELKRRLPSTHVTLRFADAVAHPVGHSAPDANADAASNGYAHAPADPDAHASADPDAHAHEHAAA